MKVLHLINTLGAGGAELHLLTLCRHLQRSGVDVTVAALRDGAAGSRTLRPDFEREGIPVTLLRGEHPFGVRYLGRLRQLLERERPAILHTHLPRADFAGVIARFGLSGLPWVCSVHDIHSRSWSGRWTLPLFNLIWRAPDAIIAISYAVKEWLVRERHLPPASITVIHYGIDVESEASAHAAGSLPAAAPAAPTIGSLARLEPRKGHDCLIRAMPVVLTDVPDARLVIAGGDPWRYGRVLRALIARLGLDKHVELLGFQRDARALLQRLDVFALATRAEGFGQVIVEAMAAGRPVVASGIAPINEIVADGETGMLAAPDDPEAFGRALSWMLRHRAEAEEMGRRGRLRVQAHFSADRMVVETLAVYRKVAGVGAAAAVSVTG